MIFTFKKRTIKKTMFWNKRTACWSNLAVGHIESSVFNNIGFLLVSFENSQHGLINEFVHLSCVFFLCIWLARSQTLFWPFAYPGLFNNCCCNVITGNSPISSNNCSPTSYVFEVVNSATIFSNWFWVLSIKSKKTLLTKIRSKTWNYFWKSLSV